VLISHLKTPTENLLTIYQPLKDKTKIVSLPKSTSDIDLEAVEKKTPKGAIIKETVEGLIVPYLESDKGKMFIKF
jgi:hypothetical protein